jgi:TonB family protein
VKRLTTNIKYILFIAVLAANCVTGDENYKNVDPLYRQDILKTGIELSNNGNAKDGTKYFYYGVQNWQHVTMKKDLISACKHLFVSYYMFDLHLKHEEKLQGCPKEELDYLYGRVDRPYVQMIKYVPKIPKRAYKLGLSGVVVVEYTITKSGKTKDLLIKEISNKIFRKSALKAARKFRYLPKIEGGEAVEVIGVENRFTYSVPEND